MLAYGTYPAVPVRGALSLSDLRKAREDVTDEDRIEEPDESMPTRTKIIVGLVGSVVVLGVAYGMLRVSSPPIRPEQTPPAGHYPLECGWCHSVTADARLFGVSGE